MICENVNLSKGSRTLVYVRCDNCGISFKKRYSDVVRVNHHFCCRNCSSQYLHRKRELELSKKVGMPFRDWLYEKYIVEQLTPRQISHYIFECEHHSKVLKWLRYYGISIRNQSECRTGKLNPNYKSDLTDDERIKRRDTLNDSIFKRSVFTRDNYTCQKCGKHGGTLNAHHLQCYADFPNLRYDTSNGVTLCLDCHKNFHKVFGYKHNTKTQFDKFISDY